MLNLKANSSPYVVLPPTDNNNYADNNICVIASGGESIVLPQISTLPSNDITIFVYNNGSVSVPVAAQGSDAILSAAGPNVAAGTAKEYVALGGSNGHNVWSCK